MSGADGSLAPELDEFLACARQFLDAHVPRRPPRVAESFGTGPDSVALLEDRPPAQQREELEAIRRWRAEEFAAGYGWISGPTRYGGRGLPRSYDAGYRRLRREYLTPPETMLGVSLGMVTPTILEFGQDLVKERYLEQLHRAQMVACQLFSEPGAGSDLSAVATRARRDGSGWRVTGQKVWTSGAHYSDLGEALCRTDGDGRTPVTVLLVDMHAPGVTVRPLRQMTGGAAFNEVFLDDVFVPDDHRLGEVDDGWRVAMATLGYERQSIGGGGEAGGGGANFARVLDLARRRAATEDPLVRRDLASLYVHMTVARWTSARLAAAGHLQAAGSIGKLSLTQNQSRISELAGRILGPRLAADCGEWGTFAWAEYVLSTPGIRLAGGTDEIQRNALAERVLGLPKEVRRRVEGSDP